MECLYGQTRMMDLAVMASALYIFFVRGKNKHKIRTWFGNIRQTQWRKKWNKIDR